MEALVADPAAGLQPSLQKPAAYLVADGRYRLGKRIAKCRSSVVHRGRELETGREVAVKLEPTCTRHPQLAYEVKMYDAHAGIPGIPATHWSGTEHSFRILVMELLGPSLRRLFRHCEGKFNVVTVVDMGVQVLNRLEYMHAKGFVHRDLRPESVLIGRGSQLGQVHLVGLALAKRYRQGRAHQHLPCGENRAIMWNPAFASVHSHRGVTHSRRDDLESLAYMLVYFCCGSLPWLDGCSTGRGMHEEVLRAKTSTPLHDLCDRCPPQLMSFLRHCRSLDYEARPDYSFLRQLLLSCLVGCPPPYDFVCDFAVRPAISCHAATGYTQEAAPTTPVFPAVRRSRSCSSQ